MKQLDATRNRALQSMSPAARQSNAHLRSPALGTPRGTPGLPGSKGKATAMRVPASDQLHALSVPRLRKQVRVRVRTRTLTQTQTLPLPLTLTLTLT